MSEPRRRCVGCGATAAQGQLTRLARRPDGSVVAGRHEQGRGAWLCAGSSACFEAASKKLGRALRCSTSTGDIDRLRATLFSGVETIEGNGRGSESSERR